MKNEPSVPTRDLAGIRLMTWGFGLAAVGAIAYFLGLQSIGWGIAAVGMFFGFVGVILNAAIVAKRTLELNRSARKDIAKQQRSDGRG